MLVFSQFATRMLIKPPSAAQATQAAQALAPLLREYH